MPNGKLLAEWFWTDRWMGSSGFLLPLEHRGLYREMMTQAWRRGARLPNDPDAIRRAVGCSQDEWDRCWPRVQPYWRKDGGYLVNDTQLEVYTEAKAMFEQKSGAGKKGNRVRWSAEMRRLRLAEQRLCESPPSPSPVSTQDQERTRANALAGFDVFWSGYPKKKSRSDAEKVWRKLAPSPALCQRIYDAVAAQRETEDWTKDGGRYVPYAATWLHKRRWEDEIHAPTEPVPKRDDAEHDWFAECQRIHAGECGLDRWRHMTRVKADEALVVRKR